MTRQGDAVLVRMQRQRHHAGMSYAPSLCSPLATPALREEEIHIWYIAYQRAQGRAPLQQLLSRYLGIEPAQVRIQDGAHGRPQLADTHATTLDFNWSHSRDHALIAVARGITPGIDLELRNRRTRGLALAGRFFSAAETQRLSALPDAAQDEAFLDVWTAKEAVLKALGHGLGFGLHRLSIRFEDKRPRLEHLDGDDVGRWQLHALDICPALVAALAWRGAARTLRYFAPEDQHVASPTHQSP
jgi:4'-phosphopantetheinyl transferase